MRTGHTNTMRITIVLGSLMMLFLLSSTCDAAPKRGSRVGIGAGFGIGGSTFATESSALARHYGITNIYLPIYIGRFIKLEPEIGLSVAGMTITHKDDGDSASIKSTALSLRTGLGIYGVANRGPLAVAIGVRGGLTTQFSWDKLEGDEDVIWGQHKGVDYRFDGFFSPTMGLEFYFTPQFSLGAQVSLEIFIGGEPGNIGGEKEDDDYYYGDSTTTRHWTISTATMIMGRWFF
jgi:hypothetical protein